MKKIFIFISLISCLFAAEQNSPLTHGKLVEAYEKGRKEYPEIFFDFLKKNVSKDTLVLDIGCGTGRSTRPLFDRFTEVHGIDPDSKMIEFAKNYPAYTKYESQYKVGSVYNLPYNNEKFGLVVMAASFHWFCNENALKEISRVLQKEGYVYVIIDSGGIPLSREYKDILIKFLGSKKVEHKKKYCPSKFFSANKFRIVEEVEFDCETAYTVEEALENYKSHSCWNFIKAADKEKEALTCLHDLLESHKNEQGLIICKSKTKALLVQKIY